MRKKATPEERNSGLNTNKLWVGFEWGGGGEGFTIAIATTWQAKEKAFFSLQKICHARVPPTHKNYFTFSLSVWGRRVKMRWFLTEKGSQLSFISFSDFQDSLPPLPFSPNFLGRDKYVVWE
jgi:hypothetical protein